MQNYYVISISKDIKIVSENYRHFLIDVFFGGVRNKMSDNEINKMIEWYRTILARLNTMLGELSPCQQ